MRKICYILFAALLPALPTSAGAQAATGTVSIDHFRTEITGDTLHIGFTLRASDLRTGRNGRLKLEFAVESDDRRLVLPPVVYTGKQRHRYERRREELSGAYHIEPYATLAGPPKDGTCELEYRLALPYYAWMEHAAVTYREYLYGCEGDLPAASGTLAADLNPAPVVVEPEIWRPDPALFPHLVSFLVPEVEEVKARASMIELRIGFPVNVTEIRPAFGNNTQELARADSLVAILGRNPLIDINGVHIKGYASPEGSYAANERLARGRSEGFRQYLMRNYPGNADIRNATTMWVAEDWEGLARLVDASDLPHKDEVLAVVLDGTMAPDTKERVLQKIGPWSEVYKVLLEDMFPRLRRIELKVDYTISRLDDNQARQLLYTQPDMLSLDEIYRVARYYEPGSRQYREVYEIAARQFPDDRIANHNAAAALLQEGNAEAALPYLEKTAGNPMSLINYGAYHYIAGDLDRAVEYFKQAGEAGVEQAAHNLRQINPAP